MKRCRAGVVLLALFFVQTLVAEEISIEEFVAHPKYRDLQISPNGRHYAAIAPVEGHNKLIFLEIMSDGRIKPGVIFSAPQYEEIAAVEWVNDERVLIRTSRIQGALELPSLTSKILALNYDGSKKKEIWSFEKNGTIARVVDYVDEDKNNIVVSHFGRNRQKPIVERLNVYNGETRRIGISPLNRGGVLLDNEQNIRFAAGQDDDLEITTVYRKEPGGEWFTFDNPLGGETLPIGIAGDDRTVFMSSDGAGQLGVHAMDLQTGEIQPIAVHDRVVHSELFLSMNGRELIGVEFVPGLPEVTYVNEQHPDSDIWKTLHATFEGMHVRTTSITDDYKTAIIAISSDTQPAAWYRYDIDAGKIKHVISSRPALDLAPMSSTESHWITARDGVEFQLYVTKPIDAGDEPLPTILYIHGGPHGPRDFWEFQDERQMLASRGYAVIQPNYRGSGGFGQAFEESGYRKWYGEMQDDITDATLWAIEQGIADKDKTCIYGASYGGYATLAGLTKTPELFACGFSFVGVYDLELMYEKGDTQERRSGRNVLERYIGRDPEELKARSPINFVSKITKPLFIAHGEQDVRAHVDHFHALRKRLISENIPFEELLTPKEGHGFYKHENRVEYAEKLLKFFDEHIGSGSNAE
jgi:dipeptidyl aminopeptidase/acylaminoacyl peptidase